MAGKRRCCISTCGATRRSATRDSRRISCFNWREQLKQLILRLSRVAERRVAPHVEMQQRRFPAILGADEFLVGEVARERGGGLADVDQRRGGESGVATLVE